MSEESIWLQRVIDGDDGEESVLVHRFSIDLLARAKRSMSARLQQRLDPEDVVQSVFRSFFVRNRDGQFQFENENDVWKLLCAMTYRKVARAARFHYQDRRSVEREQTSQAEPRGSIDEPDSAVIMMDILEHLLDGLPEEIKQIICLRLENHTHSEIAERVAVSERTVRRSLAKLREKAETLLEDDSL